MTSYLDDVPDGFVILDDRLHEAFHSRDAAALYRIAEKYLGPESEEDCAVSKGTLYHLINIIAFDMEFRDDIIEFTQMIGMDLMGRIQKMKEKDGSNGFN